MAKIEDESTCNSKYSHARSIFLQMAPLDRVIEELELTNEVNLSLESQQEIVKEILQYPLTQKYPPRKSYLAQLVKRIFNAVEKKRFEIDEDLLAMAMDLIMTCGSSTSDESLTDSCYLTFMPPSSVLAKMPIPIRVSTQCNQVGLRVWEAGFLLAEYAVANPNVFSGKRVLEIGAGVGLTGIEIAEHCKPKKVVLTDHDKVVLDNLRYNVNEYDSLRSAHTKGEANYESVISVESLDWCDDDCVEKLTQTSLNSNGELFDVVLAADCVYDPTGFHPLANMLDRMFTASKNENRELVVIFAYTLRNRSTFEAFESVLAERNINSIDIRSNVPQVVPGEEWFCYDNTTMLNRFTERSSIRLSKLEKEEV